MLNIPKMKVGIVAVSRDCFPESLSVNRRKALVDAYAKKYNAEDIYECPICIVESEIHMVQALDDLKKAGCNALCVYLGNFGPEIAETLLAKHFDGPKMFCAAAEENTGVLSSSRGDAYCGMLNASYNLKLRGVKAYIPEYPVGTASECADMIHDFLPICTGCLRAEPSEDHHFRPSSHQFPCLQCAHPAAVQPGCRDRGKLRAGSVRGVPQARQRPTHPRSCGRYGGRAGQRQQKAGDPAEAGAV